MRLDSDSCFQCNFEQDPFKRLISLNKTYGWLVGDKESIETIPTLWEKIKNWTRMHKINNEINIIHKVPVDPNEDLKTTIIDINNISNEGSLASTRQKNYLTFVFVSISIGLVLTGIAVVVVLFVKRRSLLLKSKCQLVSKTKGQQNYTTVGQSDY